MTKRKKIKRRLEKLEQQVRIMDYDRAMNEAKITTLRNGYDHLYGMVNALEALAHSKQDDK